MPHELTLRTAAMVKTFAVETKVLLELWCEELLPFSQSSPAASGVDESLLAGAKAALPSKTQVRRKVPLS